MPRLSDTISAIHAPGFDPRALAFVAVDPGCAAGSSGEAEITHFQTNSLTLTTNGSGMLVLAETWYPGWQATVDGHPTEVIKANGVLRGVCLPAGQHTLRIRGKSVTPATFPEVQIFDTTVTWHLTVQ